MADRADPGRRHGDERRRRSGPPLLSEVAFAFAYELVGLLRRENRPDLAVLVADLRVVEIRNQPESSCPVVHTAGRRARWGFGRRETIGLLPRRGTINVELVEGTIVSIKTFDRPDLARVLVPAA
jgi:hypothetical protein